MGWATNAIVHPRWSVYARVPHAGAGLPRTELALFAAMLVLASFAAGAVAGTGGRPRRMLAFVKRRRTLVRPGVWSIAAGIVLSRTSLDHGHLATLATGVVSLPGSLRLIVATDRRPVLSLFGDARERRGAVDVCHIPLSAEPLPLTDNDIARAHAAVVDASSDHGRALEVCRELRGARPALPLVGVLCCPHSTNPYFIRELAAAGVDSLLDLHTTEAEALHMIRSVIDGERVLHVRVLNGDGQRRTAQAHAPELSARELRLLELLSLGLGDQEMGARLCLSPHTVKHRVEQLRTKLALPNRIALAAWAGRYGIAPAALGREEAGCAVA